MYKYIYSVDGKISTAQQKQVRTNFRRWKNLLRWMRYSIDGKGGLDIVCTCNPNQIIPDRKHTKNIFSRSSHHKYSMLQIFWCFHRWNTLLHSDKILNLFVPSNSNLHSHTALSIDGNHIFRILMLFQILI